MAIAGCGARSEFGAYDPPDLDEGASRDAVVIDRPLVLPDTARPQYRPYRSCGALLAVGGGIRRTLAFTPDGRTLMTADDRVRLWNTRDRTLVRMLDTGSGTAALSPDGDVIATPASVGSNAVQLWRRDGGTPIRRIETIGVVRAIAFAPDGRSFFTATLDAIARWSVDGTSMGSLATETYADALVVSPDAAFVASSAFDRTLYVRRIADGATMLTIEGNARSMTTAAFVPDGSSMAVAIAFQLRANFYRTSDWTSERPMPASIGSVRSVAISRDGSMIAIGELLDRVTIGRSDDRTTLQVIVTGDRSDALGVNAVAFSDDGTMLATGSSGGPVRLWCTDVMR